MQYAWHSAVLDVASIDTACCAMHCEQARLRMVMSYMMAQLLPWVRGHSPGFLLVLGSGNVDEGLRGYMTKYDCSSADLNPIGSINKGDLKLLLKWAATKYGYSALSDVVKATPTAELRPFESGQSDGEHTQVCTYTWVICAIYTTVH
jgi:NAD+ synthase (glutamine-hydrolysing)